MLRLILEKNMALTASAAALTAQYVRLETMISTAAPVAAMVEFCTAGGPRQTALPVLARVPTHQSPAATRVPAHPGPATPKLAAATAGF